MQDQQTAEFFIGRTREINLFMHWLNNPSAPWILYLHDSAEQPEKRGGVGKTRLLHKYAEIVEQRYKDVQVVMIDFFNIADRDGITIAERVVAGLRTLYPEWFPSLFTEVLSEYRTLSRSEGIDTTDMRQNALANALAEDLQQLDSTLVQKGKLLLVFFDTFEIVEQNPVSTVLRDGQTFPDNYQFKHLRAVVAGRNQLDWTHPNWQGRGNEVQSIALDPFSPEEMQRYIEREAVQEILQWREKTEPLYTRTEGRPILIGLVTDVLNHRILTLDELVKIPVTGFESYLVERINQIEKPLNWVVLFMAHVYHRFNLPILYWILREVPLLDPVPDFDPQELLVALARLSFVRHPSSGEDFALHDEMRRLVTKYCWPILDTNQSTRKAISRCVIAYYEQEIARVQDEDVQQVYTIEMLYHRLFLDLNEGIQYFQHQFQKATRLWKNSFARLLLQEAQKFIPFMSLEQKNRLQFEEATLQRIENEATAALRTLEDLERNADPSWLKEHRKNLLFDKGRCNYQMSDYPHAADCFRQCLEIADAAGKAKADTQLRANVLSHLAGIFRRQGQLDKSLGSYEECIALYKKAGNTREYAVTLHNISLIYRLQGKIEEALRWCKSAWLIRLSLAKEGKIGDVPVGLSLAALGMIYIHSGDIVEADKRFHQAFDIFTRADYRRGIATMYNRFGQLYLARNERAVAREWFQKAQLATLDLDREQQINSLNKLGRISLQEQKWNEAIAFFERAIELANQVHDDYQQTESLIDLAETLEHMGQQERAGGIWQIAGELAVKNNYPYLLGMAEKTQGELRYFAYDYAAAFRHFAAYCHYMMLYNAFEYGKAVRKVTDALFGLSMNNIPTAVDELMNYWSEHQLKEDHPELVEACEEIKNLTML